MSPSNVGVAPEGSRVDDGGINAYCPGSLLDTYLAADTDLASPVGRLDPPPVSLRKVALSVCSKDPKLVIGRNISAMGIKA
jgi:hypothetical protein